MTYSIFTRITVYFEKKKIILHSNELGFRENSQHICSAGENE